MTTDQFRRAIWEAVAQLMDATDNTAGHAMVRGWTDRGGPPEVVVAQARAAFEASITDTFTAYLHGIAQPLVPATATAPASMPVVDADVPPAEERRAELLRWLADEYPWAELTSDDSYVALRAASLLRNTVDALRTYGWATEVAALLEAKGYDPRAVL